MLPKTWFVVLIMLLTLIGCSDHDDNNSEEYSPPITLTQIQLTIDTNQFPIGISHTASAIGYYSDGSTESGLNYTWASDDDNIAFVDSFGNISGISSDETKITVTEQGITSSITITITDAIPLSIEIFDGYNSVAAGHSVQYKAMALYSDQKTYDITNTTT